MTKYQEFLDAIGIISENDFNEIIDSLPNFNIDESISRDIDFYDLSSLDSVSSIIINEILKNWDYCYAEDVDFIDKTFELNDVDSLEDLKEIKNTFPKWTIINYDDLKSQIEEERNENENYCKMEKLIQKIRTRFENNVDELEKLLMSYDNQG